MAESEEWGQGVTIDQTAAGPGPATATARPSEPGDMSLLNRPKSSKRLLQQGGGESQDAAATSTTALGRGRGTRSSSSSARARDTEKAGRLPSLAQVNREIMDQVSRYL